MTHTIIRARRRRRFLVVDQSAVEDVRLSWAARGLLAYLLSRPDDWRVLVNDLKRRGDLGRDGIYKLLRELRDVGYVRYERARDRDGRLRGGTYFVSEVPHTPHPDFPDTAEPDEAPPDPANPEALPNTESDLTRTTTTTPTTTKGRCSSSDESTTVEFALWVPSELRGSAAALVAPLEPETAQAVIDEWAGVMAAGSIRFSPLGYLHALIARAQAGDFVPKLAEKVAEFRTRQNITL